MRDAFTIINYDIYSSHNQRYVSKLTSVILDSEQSEDAVGFTIIIRTFLGIRILNCIKLLFLKL